MANARPEFLILYGRMRIAENEANANRNNSSVFKSIERLNKQPSVFINYLRALASAKGMTFTIQQQPKEGASPQRNNTNNARNVSNIVEAKDLSHEQYEDISNRKKTDNTTTDNDLQAEKHYWQNFFSGPTSWTKPC